jgi:hypothetical protein
MCPPYQPFGSSQTHDSGTDYSNNKATIAVVSFVVLQRSQWSLDNSITPDINNGVLSPSKSHDLKGALTPDYRP